MERPGLRVLSVGWEGGGGGGGGKGLENRPRSTTPVHADQSRPHPAHTRRELEAVVARYSGRDTDAAGAPGGLLAGELEVRAVQGLGT